jgi:hypothetical protein
VTVTPDKPYISEEFQCSKDCEARKFKISRKEVGWISLIYR